MSKKLETPMEMLLDSISATEYDANRTMPLIRADAARVGDELTRLRAENAMLVEALRKAHSLIAIGGDCTWALAKLQREGIYKPACDDGKPSNADASKDYARLVEGAKEVREALAKVKP